MINVHSSEAGLGINQSIAYADRFDGSLVATLLAFYLLHAGNVQARFGFEQSHGFAATHGTMLACVAGKHYSASG